MSRQLESGPRRQEAGAERDASIVISRAVAGRAAGKNSSSGLVPRACRGALVLGKSRNATGRRTLPPSDSRPGRFGAAAATVNPAPTSHAPTQLLQGIRIDRANAVGGRSVSRRKRIQAATLSRRKRAAASAATGREKR